MSPVPVSFISLASIAAVSMNKSSYAVDDVVLTLICHNLCSILFVQVHPFNMPSCFSVTANRVLNMFCAFLFVRFLFFVGVETPIL